jgi:nucleoside phosphorylase
VRLVLIPQGAEFTAVQRGWHIQSHDRLIPIPAGIAPVEHFLPAKFSALMGSESVIVMGLCGALSPELELGETVIYQTCQTTKSSWQLPHQSTNYTIVNAITTDRVITTVHEKQRLYESSHCDVVDMEGSAIAQFFQPQNLPVTMIRVVSDDCSGDLPDLSQAFGTAGQIQPLALASTMLRSPRSAIRLIRGSLIGLKQLTLAAREISSSPRDFCGKLNNYP